MAFLINILFKIAYYGATLGYPAYQVYLTNKQNKVDRLWILYFFIFGIFTILESTLLWPVKAFFNLISCCIWCSVKFLLAVWLQHPKYRGALLIEDKGFNYLEMGHNIIYPFASKVLPLLGFPDRSQANDSAKKTE